MSFSIIGTGMYVPENTVTNDNISKLVDTNDEWIKQRVGISERRISTHETATDMAYQAALRALENAGTSPEELDLIIGATVSGENICPSVASLLQRKLGASCPAYDINAACSAFIFLLETAAGYFARGKAKKILVVGAERLSGIVDWSDRGTCIIFGDGAGAAVLQSGDGYLDSEISTEGGDDVIKIPAFAGSSPFYTAESDAPYIMMHGQETFKYAVNAITHDINVLLERNNLSKDDIKYIVPHQANSRIIDLASRKLKIPIEKFVMNIDKYGNTSSASIPMALDEINRAGRLRKGDLIILTAFGGGLSNGACLIKW